MADPDRRRGLPLTYPELYDAATRKAARDMRIKAKIKFAVGAARRLLDARPLDWPKPETQDETIETVKRIMASPRKFGVCLTAPERRALDFVHALHAASKEQEQRGAESVAVPD